MLILQLFKVIECQRQIFQFIRTTIFSLYNLILFCRTTIVFMANRFGITVPGLRKEGVYGYLFMRTIMLIHRNPHTSEEEGNQTDDTKKTHYHQPKVIKTYVLRQITTASCIGIQKTAFSGNIQTKSLFSH